MRTKRKEKRKKMWDKERNFRQIGHTDSAHSDLSAM
jgi:transposase